jgi:hypothetical protein
MTTVWNMVEAAVAGAYAAVLSGYLLCDWWKARKR